MTTIVTTASNTPISNQKKSRPLKSCKYRKPYQHISASA